MQSSESHTFLASEYAMHTVWLLAYVSGYTLKVATVYPDSSPIEYRIPLPFSNTATSSTPLEYAVGPDYSFLRAASVYNSPSCITSTYAHSIPGIVENQLYILYAE